MVSPYQPARCLILKQSLVFSLNIFSIHVASASGVRCPWEPLSLPPLRRFPPPLSSLLIASGLNCSPEEPIWWLTSRAVKKKWRGSNKETHYEEQLQELWRATVDVLGDNEFTWCLWGSVWRFQMNNVENTIRLNSINQKCEMQFTAAPSVLFRQIIP